MISSRATGGLGSIERLKNFCQKLAAFESELYEANKDPSFPLDTRRFRYEEQGNVALFSEWNDEETGYVIAFGPAGAVIRGFAGESAMSLGPDDDYPDCPWLGEELEFWSNPPYPGVLENLPKVLHELFRATIGHRVIDGATFCIWRQTADSSWSIGNIEFPEDEKDPDGSEDCLYPLEGKISDIKELLERYYGVTLDDAKLTKAFS